MKINSRFTKKAVSIIVSAAMLLSQGTAIHAEGGEGQVSAPVSYPYQFEMMQADGVGSLEDVGEPISLWGFRGGSFDTNYRNQLDSESQKIYDAILSAYSNGANSNTVTIDITDETFNNVSVTSTLETDAQGEQYYQLSFDNSVFGWVDEQLTPAFLALVYDHPELPWLVNVAYTYGSSEIGLSENIAAVGTFTRDVTLGNISFTLKEVLSDSGSKSDMDNAVSNAKTAINSDIENSTVRYDILKGIHDYLSDTITYNDTAADKNQTKYSEGQLRLYQTAYSAFYKCNGDTTEDNTTVCAGYAKGFKLLCDSYGIPCVYVSGFAGEEAHGWNYVQMEDNNWYAVDVTWDDQDKAEPYYDFFLAGADSVPENFEPISFSASHTSSGNWASAGYNFIYPALNADKYVCAPTVVTPLEASHVTLSSTTLTYNGSAQTPTITVKVGETTLVEGTDYTVIMPYDITNVGTKTITITGIGNYRGTVAKTYEILKATATFMYPPLKSGLVYNGSAQLLCSEGTPTGGIMLYRVGTDGDFSVALPTATLADTYEIYCKVVGDGNYNDSNEYRVGEVTIAKKNLSTAAVITLDKDSYEYTGKAVIPVVTVKDGEKTLTEDTDYTVEVENDVENGTGLVEVTFKGNYTGTASKTFPITLGTIIINMIEGVPNTEGQGDAWDFDAHSEPPKITLYAPYTFEFNGDVGVSIENHGTIKNGTFNDYVGNMEGATISDGTFNNGVDNMEGAIISGGTFDGSVGNMEGAIISDGTFNGDVFNYGTISGGEFSDYVNNYEGGTISGGTFTGETTNNGTIENGTFNDNVQNNSTINGGTFDCLVHNYDTISGGTFSGDVNNYEGGTISGGSFAAITNMGTINITYTDGTYSVTVSESTTDQGEVYINGELHAHVIGEVTGCEEYNETNHKKSGLCTSCPLKCTVAGEEEAHYIHHAENAADADKIALCCICGFQVDEIVISAPAELTYDGTEKKAVLSENAVDSGLDEADIQYYAANGANIGAAPVDAGTYKAMIGLDGVNAEVDFTIAPKDISKLPAPVPSELYYEGRTQNIVFSFPYGDYYLQAVTDYDMTGTVSAENAGTYTVTMTGKKNFTGTITADWTIKTSEIAQLTAFLDAEDNEVEFTKEYDGTTGFNGEIATVSFKNQKGTPMTLAVGNGAAVNVVFADAAVGATTCTAVITLSGETRNNFVEESYVFSGLTAEITKKKAKVTVAPTPIELAYNEAPQKLVTEGTAENGTMQYGINDGNSWTWSDTVPEKTDGGEYKVYYRAKAINNNFADSDFDETTDFVTVIIEKVTPQFVYTKNSPIYTGEEHELLTINLLSPGCVVEYSFDRTNWSTDIPKGKEAGDYKVYYRIKGTNNYSDYSGNNFKVTIAKATPDTSTIPEPVATEITYGQTLSQSVLENGWKWTDETKLPSVGESCEAYYTVDDKNYDYSNVTGYDAERHAIVMPAIITVNKADVTVKADDKYIVVGAELPEATYTVDGLVEDDSLVTAPTIGYSGADNMTIGEYDIVVKGADAGDNYEVTHVNGKLYVGLCDHNGTTKQSYDTEYHWNYCTKCGQTDMEKEAHNGGTATCTKQAVCKDCNIPYGKAKGHSWKTEWSSNSTHHWHECGNADCPVTADSGKDGYGAHTFGEWTTVTAPTATAKGTEKHSCICGYEETRDVPPTGSSGGNGGPGIVDPGIRPPVSTTTTHIITGAPDWSPNPSRPATTTTTTTTTRPPEDDEEIDDDIYEEDDSAEPQIKGDNGKMGWDVIEDEILDAEEGGTVTVDMNGATEVPEDILEQIQGKDIDLVIELENGAVWTINGESVTDPSDIDLGVEFDADIPVKVINSVTGESDYVTISIAHDGEFGFTAVLTVDMGDENEGLYANLYWYTDGGAEFICADKINSRGKADLTFTHASDYIIVIDEDNHGKRVEESADGDVDDEIVTDEDDDANPFTAVTISFTGVIVSAAAVMLTRKRRK